MVQLVGWMLLWQLSVAPAAAPAAAQERPSALGPPVADSVLDGERGGDGIDLFQLGWIDARATMSGNVVYSSVNGANSLAEGALTGVSGIATVIQNSGNQVIIQNALVLNLTLK